MGPPGASAALDAKLNASTIETAFESLAGQLKHCTLTEPLSFCKNPIGHLPWSNEILIFRIGQ